MYLPEELLILPRAGRGIKGDGEKKKKKKGAGILEERQTDNTL